MIDKKSWNKYNRFKNFDPRIEKGGNKIVHQNILFLL